MKPHFNVAKEELSFYGVDSVSLQNLLAVLIGPKAEPEVTGRIASLGVTQLANLSEKDLTQYEGIGEITAKRIMAAFGLAFHINKAKREDKFIVRSPMDAARYFDDLKAMRQEQFEVIYLNTKNVITHRRMVFKGSLNASVVHPRELFGGAMKESAASIIVAHNHPSGDPTPSPEDIDVTKRLLEVGKMIGIEVLDHIIIGQDGYVSLKEKGYV